MVVFCNFLSTVPLVQQLSIQMEFLDLLLQQMGLKCRKIPLTMPVVSRKVEAIQLFPSRYCTAAIKVVAAGGTRRGDFHLS